MRTAVLVAACVLLALPVVAHDMFLIAPDHDFPANSAVTLSLYNGTFAKSENTIDRDRLIDVTVVDGEGEATHPGTEQWRDEGNVSLLGFKTGEPGTYIVGVSTKPRTFELSAADFNEYLEHDGVLDVLAARHEGGLLDSAARERYSKHVKTILQVGDGVSGTWAHRLGYPVEIVPLTDPGLACPGETLELEILVDGDPISNQLVYASYEGYHQHEGSDHREAITTRSDDSGVARVDIAEKGRWYVRLIHMVESDEEDVDYVSNWATLTFEAECTSAQ